jgi:MoaA/NifB/PqqE/SkfB family radical SAM enzyme
MRYSPFRHLPSIAWKASPIQLTFFVTRRCNAHCPFCFYLRSADGPGPHGKELTLQEIDRIASSMGDLLWLAFSGGEIYLREDITEIARIFYRRNRPAIMLFPTNGMLPELIRKRTEEVLRSCTRSVVVVKLSLDGVGPAHDALRNTPGSFERTMQTYELLCELVPAYPHFELGVNTVFCSANQDAMDSIIDYVLGMSDIRTHTISLARGALLEERFKTVDLAKYERAIQRLELNLKRGRASTYRFTGARMKAAQDILQRKLILRTAREQQGVIDCYAGRLNVVLRENGELYPCEIREDGFGNVRDYGYDIRKMLGTETASGVVGSIQRRECFCTHECYFMTNILFNPRLYPALAKEYLSVGL